MIEITLAVVILAAALIPVFMLTTTTGQQTLAMEKHIVAARFAAGVLDRYLAMPFKQCADEILAQKFPLAVLENEEFTSLISEFSDDETLKKTLQGFVYEVKIAEPAVLEEFAEMFKITVTVNWPERVGDKASRQVSLSAVKFNENP